MRDTPEIYEEIQTLRAKIIRWERKIDIAARKILILKNEYNQRMAVKTAPWPDEKET